MGNGKEAPVRLRCPDRSQITMRMECDEDLIPQGHQARVIWAAVGKLDLSAFCEAIKARQGVCGRNATDRRLLISLWLYAYTRGEGSAREVARLCTESKPYRWLCGGVSMNHHTLSDFRVGHGQALDDLFTQVLASLLDKGLIKVSRISQDGTRVRACAGAASFRGEKRLEELLAEARQHVEELRSLLDDPEKSAHLSARKKGAQARAARERVQRIEAAMAQLPQLKDKQQEAAKKAGDGEYGRKVKQGKVRVSTTDAESRVMKMGDGGFRPALNVQFASDTQNRAIVGVDVSSAGSDKGLAEPMRQQVQERTGAQVQEHLMDGGFLVLEEIDRAAEEGTTLIVPPPIPRDPAKIDTRYQAKASDSPAQAVWRERMGSAESKQIYRQRAATIETVNADMKAHRGMGQFRVKGVAKAKCVALWCALAYNLVHFGVAMSS